MNEELITVHGGILGTRKIAGAYADLVLRRLGLIVEGQSTVNRYIAWGQKGRRPWRADELQRMEKLLAEGVRIPVIAKALGRTKFSIYKKLAA